MPKTLSEQYLEILEQKKRYTLATDNKTAPMPGENPAEFIAFQAESREIARHKNHMEKAIYSENYSADQLNTILGTYYGKKEYEKLKLSTPNDLRYESFITEHFFDFHPELRNELSDKELKKFENDSDDAMVIVSNLTKKGKLTKADNDYLIASFLLMQLTISASTDKPFFLQTLESNLTEAQKNSILQKFGDYKPIGNEELEKQVTHPYSEKIDELRNHIPSVITKNPALLKEYTDALKYADDHLTLVNDSIKDERFSYAKDVSNSEDKYTQKVVHENIETFENGKYSNLYNKFELKNRTSQYINPEKTETFNELLNYKTNISDNTKEGLKLILQKMEDMKLHEFAYDVTGEDGNKIYGQCKLLRKKNKLINAINAKDPNKIIEAKKEYEETWNDMQELYRLAQQYFSQDKTFFPGNVDGTRNNDLPWEFTNDVMTTSQINTVFLFHMHIKQNKRTIDEFIENPTNNYYSKIEADAMKYSFEGISAGKNFSDCLDILLSRDKYLNGQDILSINVFSASIGRVAAGSAYLEKDKDKQINNIIGSHEFSKIWSNVLDLNNAKFSYLSNISGKPELRAIKHETLCNLLSASDKDRNLNKMLAGIPETDIFGRVKGESFNWKSYVNNVKADYEGIIQRYNIMLQKASKGGLLTNASNCISKPESAEAFYDVCRLVLEKNANDRENQGYKALEDRFLTLSYDLPSNTPADIKTKIENGIKEYRSNLRKPSPADYLGRINDSVKRATLHVHGGSSEYTDAMKALTALERDYRAFQSYGKFTPSDMKEDQLDKIRRETEDAAEKIRKYLDYKDEQVRRGKKQDEKSKKRIQAMRLSLSSLDELTLAVNEKNTDLDRQIADRNNKLNPNISDNKVETKEELIQKLRNAEIADNDFSEFIEKLDILNNEMGSLMKPDKDGWKELDPDTLSSLKKSYYAASDKLELFIEKNKNARDANTVSIRETCKKLSAIMTKDMTVLNEYNPEKGLKTLPTLLEDSRIDTLYISNPTLKKKSGNQSVRIPMSYIDNNGQQVNGYFTQATYYDPIGNLNSFAASASKKAKTPEGAQLMRGMIANYQQYLENQKIDIRNNPKIAKSFVEFTAKPDSDSAEISRTRLINLMATVYNKSEKDIQKLCGNSCLDSFKKQLEKVSASMIITAGTEIPDKARLDIRNEGMSIMADLLGMSEIVCRSRAMKLRAKDGTMIDGTFMEESTGIDPGTPIAMDFRPTPESLCGGSGRALKQLADLQVLDYLCGNTDRHGSNIFYKFKNGKVSSIQAIDNDCSFGELDGVIGFNHMVAPNNMLVLSEKTAKRILSFTPAQLKFALRGRIEEKAIDAACKRLSQLKESINNSLEYHRTHSRQIEYGRICLLKDEEWKKIDVNHLVKKNSNSIFGKACKGLAQIAELSGIGKPTEMQEIGSLNRATQSGIKNEVKTVTQFIKNINAEKAPDKGPQDSFAKLQNSAREYYTVLKNIQANTKSCKELVKNGDTSPEAIFGQYINKRDLAKLQECSNNLNKAAQTFYNEKSTLLNGRNPDKKLKAKLDAAKDIITYTESRMQISREETSRVEANLRQATEKMMKLNKAMSSGINHNNPVNADNNNPAVNSNNRRTNTKKLGKGTTHSSQKKY